MTQQTYMSNCNSCGAGLTAHERFCTRCGASGAGQQVALRPARSGTLLASGILSLVTGAVYVLMAIATLSMKDSFLGDMVDDATGVLTLMLLVFCAFAIGFIVVGSGACAVKPWAQVGTLVLGGLSLAFFLIVLVASGEASLVIPVMWFGLIVALAAAARTRASA